MRCGVSRTTTLFEPTGFPCISRFELSTSGSKLFLCWFKCLVARSKFAFESDSISSPGISADMPTAWSKSVCSNSFVNGSLRKASGILLRRGLRSSNPSQFRYRLFKLYGSPTVAERTKPPVPMVAVIASLWLTGIEAQLPMGNFITMYKVDLFD